MLSTTTKLRAMQELWNTLSRKSRLGFVSHLQKGAVWDEEEFQVTGERFVERMMERLEEYGSVEPADAAILEIGCGVGRFLRPLASRSNTVTGIDFSEEMLRAAASYCADFPNVSLIQNDGASLQQLEDASFDYCVTAGVFQHITHIDIIAQYCREALRVLKDHGLFLFQFEGNRTWRVGFRQRGTRVTATDLDEALRNMPYRVREISIDPDDPIRNVVIVIQKLPSGQNIDENDRSFRNFPMSERPWITGVYDGLTTRTQIHVRLKKKPKRLTFYD